MCIRDSRKLPGWLLAFGIALLAAGIMFLPFIIYEKGNFFFFGDFNVQQIPFYRMAHDAVRSGEVLWNSYTDLGANFIASYSFYLLFSPFFWLTLPFPSEMVPYLMAPLLMLKTASMALTSYFYIRRFVRTDEYAIIGSLCYAFSGFATYNIFFNHFHEAMVFFPLLLIGVEELVQNRRRGDVYKRQPRQWTAMCCGWCAASPAMKPRWIPRRSSGGAGRNWRRSIRRGQPGTSPRRSWNWGRWSACPAERPGAGSARPGSSAPPVPPGTRNACR